MDVRVYLHYLYHNTCPNKGLQGMSESKLFNTFFRLYIVLSDSIPSLTFLCLNLSCAQQRSTRSRVKLEQLDKYNCDSK